MADKKDIKRYKCTNYGACNAANNNQVIEIDAIETLGGTPDCPHCQQHTLEEIVKKPFPTKLIAIIVAALVVIGGAVAALLTLGGGPRVNKIVLSEEKLTLVLDEQPKALLTATAIDKDSNEVKDAKLVYVWSVNDENIAKVTHDGEVTALEKGKTSITVKIEGDDKHRAVCQVEVKERDVIVGAEGDTPQYVAVESLSMEDAFTLKEGESKKLVIAVAPQDHEEAILVESSDESVAAVTGPGEVQGVKAGTATITVTTDKSGHTASATVTVEKKPTTGGGAGGGGNNGKINLGFGVYEGPVSGGKANGIGGEIRFTRNYAIDLKKASGETVEVESGDVMINVKMKDNRIIQGLLKRKDGSQRMIIIG